MGYTRLMDCVSTISGLVAGYDQDWEKISNGRKIIFKKYDKIYLKVAVVDNTDTGGNNGSKLL